MVSLLHGSRYVTSTAGCSCSCSMLFKSRLRFPWTVYFFFHKDYIIRTKGFVAKPHNIFKRWVFRITNSNIERPYSIMTNACCIFLTVKWRTSDFSSSSLFYIDALEALTNFPSSESPYRFQINLWNHSFPNPWFADTASSIHHSWPCSLYHSMPLLFSVQPCRYCISSKGYEEWWTHKDQL